MLRFDATKLIVSLAGDRAIVSNLGPTTDELWHVGHRDKNFYTYGSMGLCSSIALGMAVSTDEQVISLDGDGSLLMNLGTIATIGREQPQNLIVVVWDNEEWGGRRVTSPATQPKGPTWPRWRRVATYPGPRRYPTLEELGTVFQTALEEPGPWFIVAKIEEAGYMPVAPIEPELTIYRMRDAFLV